MEGYMRKIVPQEMLRTSGHCRHGALRLEPNMWAGCDSLLLLRLMGSAPRWKALTAVPRL